MASTTSDQIYKFSFLQSEKTFFFARNFLFIILFVVFQSIIVLQKPFIHIDSIAVFYTISGLQLCFFLVSMIYDIKQKFKFYLFDLILIFMLFNSQPYFSTAFLVIISVVLFLAGLHLKQFESLLLCLIASVFLSLLNLKTLHWNGPQNLLSLVLFNLTFGFVILISTQFKNELFSLKDNLLKSDIKLKTQLNLSRILLEHVPVGVFATNSSQQVLFQNKSLAKKLNVSSEMAQQLASHSNLNKLSRISMYNAELKEKRFYEKDQASYFDQELNENVNIHLIKDVTEQINIEDQLKQQEKLAAIGQLAAGIAHEIRNPLAGISGSIELLSQEASNPDDQKLMKIILREIDRLNNLITEFLDYSKPDQFPDQFVDLSLVLDEVISNVKLSSQKILTKPLMLDIHINKLFVYGYTDKLKQAFLNIAVNSVQAMKDAETPQLQIKMTEQAQKICISIKDNGSGMTENVKNRIFEPFFTTKSKGTGLGMAITQKIFDTHQALVEINTELGVGTEFKIFFNKINKELM